MGKLLVPYKEFSGKKWIVNFEDRPSESGDIDYVASEYLCNGLIYEYCCDNEVHHAHNFSGVLESVLKAVENGHSIDFNGFEKEYSEQELSMLTRLVDKIAKDMEKYHINDIVDKATKDTTKPYFKINVVEDDHLSIYDSKLGGKPFWTSDLEYPKHIEDKNGKPLMFLAQINFEDLPKNDLLPKTGLLQFFIASDDNLGLYSNGYKVVYHKDLKNPVDVNITLGEDEFSPILKEGRLLFEFGEESISVDDGMFYSLVERLDDELDPIELDILYDRFNSGCGNKLLGYPAFTQEDPEDRYDDGYDTLLFQLDSDYIFTNWGDSGIGNFFINSEKLKQADFSDVLYNWDCC